MFHFKKELDSTELIKWIFAVFGVSTAFYLVSLKEIENDSARLMIETAKAKKEAVENVIQYRPRLRIHYTNMLSEDGKSLNIRVFVESKSVQEIYIRPPNLSLLNSNGNEIAKNGYSSNNIASFQGFISPQVPFNINYKVSLLSNAAREVDSVRLIYQAEADNISAKAMSSYLKTFNDPEINKLALDTVVAKKFSYKEEVYKYGNNDIWDDFWESPK
ncbi:MAG: hypothetical protein JKX67_10945 [Colwellia sp.]|nr:hypothetical protein [Colwellia sp.]